MTPQERIKKLYDLKQKKELEIEEIKRLIRELQKQVIKHTNAQSQDRL